MPAPAHGGKAPACPTESQEQKALFGWWRAYARNTSLVMLHIPNGGARNAITGARMKAEGVAAGVPDILLAASRQGCHGLWIELKRQKGGRVSEAQEGIMTALRQAGYRVEVCRGWLAARDVIENYLNGARPQAGRTA